MFHIGASFTFVTFMLRTWEDEFNPSLAITVTE